MKKLFKPKSLALIAAFVLAFGLGFFIGVGLSTSETDSSMNKLVGTWVEETDSGSGGGSFTLEADGTVYDRDGLVEDIVEDTWSDDEIVSWKISSEDELVFIDSYGYKWYCEYSISGKILTICPNEYPNSEYTFTKS